MRKDLTPPTTWTIPAAFALVYAIWTVLDLPKPFYAPTMRQVFWGKPADTPSMGWYGLVVVSLALGLPIGLVMAAWIRRRSETWRQRGPWVAVGIAMVAMIATAGHEVVKWML
jgi:hypothetical protein